MRFKDVIKRMFITRKCILCNDVISYENELPFCDECFQDWNGVLDTLCNKCGFDSEYCSCLPQKVIKINNGVGTFGVFYKPNSGEKYPANRIVYMLKRDHNKELIDFCASIMKQKCEKICGKYSINYRNFIVTYPTRRKSGIIKYGYDHAFLLAKSFAKKMNIELKNCFINIGKHEQKKLTSAQRSINATSSYMLRKNIDLNGKDVFLIDDVMTTGSTLSICAEILKLSGANRVIPITFAKDMI